MPAGYSRLMLQHLITHFSPTLLITTLLLATTLAHQSGSPLLFLPAGVQLLAGFVYGLRSLPGCTLGLGFGMSLLAHHTPTAESLTLWLLYGALSTLCLVGLIHLVCRLSDIDNQLSNLSYRHILLVIILQTTCDATLRTSLGPAPEHMLAESTHLQLWLITASGNLLGSMAVALSLWVLAGLRHKHI